MARRQWAFFHRQIQNSLRTRLTALLLALVCTFGLIPTTAFAAGDTIKLKDFGYTGVTYESAALGRAQSIRCISTRRHSHDGRLLLHKGR